MRRDTFSALLASLVLATMIACSTSRADCVCYSACPSTAGLPCLANSSIAISGGSQSAVVAYVDTITVTVRDYQNNPVSGAEVWVWDADGVSGSGEIEIYTTQPDHDVVCTGTTIECSATADYDYIEATTASNGVVKFTPRFHGYGSGILFVGIMRFCCDCDPEVRYANLGSYDARSPDLDLDGDVDASDETAYFNCSGGAGQCDFNKSGSVTAADHKILEDLIGLYQGSGWCQ